MKSKLLFVLIVLSTIFSNALGALTVNADIQYYDDIYQDENHRLYVGTAAAPDLRTYWNQAAGRSIFSTWTSSDEYGHFSLPPKKT